ncbi:RYamide neuropeptides-like [Dendroctonus ponderosae]|nr:RYamide neuropeptides-like [Dendroctonus ponderosae]KAH0998409.1 hypothetical protein HUJ05_005772 [Dendroctonus ponderosae]KAH1000724.1 hypothetical protein HUJ04_013019 [Dendroctonus ponderosae]KAH1006727.1 hypothetical protein HUJ05_007435 [Dendroctonus ponderosae]
MLVRKVPVIFVFLVSIFITVVNADMESIKRIPSHSFKQMMRYGRSSANNEKINVNPRADLFYLGPRYGKRAGPTLAKLDTVYDSTFMPCTYTGVADLYRCDTSRSTMREDRRK